MFGFVEEKFENGKRMKKIQFSERERERENFRVEVKISTIGLKQ